MKKTIREEAEFRGEETGKSIGSDIEKGSVFDDWLTQNKNWFED